MELAIYEILEVKSWGLFVRTLLTDQQRAHSDGHHSVFSKLGVSETDALRTASQCAINYGMRVHAKAQKISSKATSVTTTI
jgi:hypothetical protein